MNSVPDRLREFLALQNITVYGMGPSLSLEREPEGYRPSDLLPDAQSVFCIGTAVAKGVFRAGPRTEKTYWRTAGVVYRHLDAVLARCAALLEEEGELAVPVFGCFPYDVKGKGDLWGYMNLVKMAEVSGLGSHGRNGLLINSKAGARLLLGGLVTTARLPDYSTSEHPQAGCPSDCTICHEACPVNAIEFSGRVDRLKCVRYSMRSPLFVHLLKSGEVSEADMELVNQVTGVDDHSMYTCVACVAVCPLG